MTNTLPTVDIKGKDYVLVKDRVLYFNDTYTNGSIQTELVSPIESKIVVVKATVTPDVKNPSRTFVDYSQAVIGQGMVNMTAALENASTSAIGRALGLMGIGVVESIASADEVHKAINSESITREVTADGCTHAEHWLNKVKNETSENFGRQYKSCKSCKKFLGWYTGPVVVEDDADWLNTMEGKQSEEIIH